MLLGKQLVLTMIILTVVIVGADCRNLVTADIDAYPWSSVGKLYNRAGEGCTGALVSRTEVVTAAHCLYNPRTGLLLHPGSLHFLIGYRQGEYREDLTVSEFTSNPDYKLNATMASEINDWATLKLTGPPTEDIKPLLLADKPAKVGDRIMIGGFAQVRRYSMTADQNCTVTAILPNGLLVHDCTVMKGDSGAPVLRTNGETFEVVGIHVASAQIAGDAVQIAVPVSSLPQSDGGVAGP